VELPLFALHSVLYPGGDLELQVFEERYLRMMEDVLPQMPFAIAAIRHGREVGGPYGRTGSASRGPVDFELADDGTYLVHVHADERIRSRASPTVRTRGGRSSPFRTWAPSADVAAGAVARRSLPRRRRCPGDLRVGPTPSR
jgi:Lon protease-like protein